MVSHTVYYVSQEFSHVGVAPNSSVQVEPRGRNLCPTLTVMCIRAQARLCIGIDQGFHIQRWVSRPSLNSTARSNSIFKSCYAAHTNNYSIPTAQHLQLSQKLSQINDILQICLSLVSSRLFLKNFPSFSILRGVIGAPKSALRAFFWARVKFIFIVNHCKFVAVCSV